MCAPAHFQLWLTMQPCLCKPWFEWLLWSSSKCLIELFNLHPVLRNMLGTESLHAWCGAPDLLLGFFTLPVHATSNPGGSGFSGLQELAVWRSSNKEKAGA
mmetsp:Transcript_73177/g.169757  ORF Transcript_73177/g.169757 Transcript_73177/m.169757 type:complete len:101 (-) Transcript_73177:7-309(-)